MKKSFYYKLLVPAGILLGMYACKKSFLDKPPLGTYQPLTVANKAGVAGLLIGAYSMLDGIGGAGSAIGPYNDQAPGGGNYSVPGDNWIYGGIASDDAHKGSDPGDQPDFNSISSWSEVPTNGTVAAKWRWAYDAVQRCNDVLRAMRLATDLLPADTIEASAEARFLRAHYHFELKKIWGNVPWVDETVTFGDDNWRVTNTVDIWPKIEDDLKYAMTNLPPTQGEIGRVNKYAAEAFLAKAYLFQHKYSDAQPLLDDLITNGKTAGGLKYDLVDKFNDNFNAETDNNKESVFACQMSANDNTGAANANQGDVLNFPYNNGDVPFVNCCGFYQPSYSLANSFVTDPVTGLPDVDNFNAQDMRNDEGLLKTDPFTPYGTVAGETVDPRIDWTIGRRGIPYLDWKVHPGVTWIRNQTSGGPYSPIKNAPYQRQNGILTDKSSWTAGFSALNYNFIRFADVLLWAAEVEVEIGSLDKAETYVNRVRNRAANPEGFVHTYINNSDPLGGFTNTPAANYLAKPYPAGYFTLKGQAESRKYVQFERKLELAMEGHRFFDLVRYGTAEAVLNAYVQHETHATDGMGHSFPYTLLKDAVFQPTDIYFAIPQAEIDKSHDASGNPTLKQNPGY